MGRGYTRKTIKRDSNNIVRALQAIQAGMATRTAARDLNIPEATLRRHLNNKQAKAATNKEPTPGPSRVSKRRKTVASYAPNESEDSLDSMD